MYFNLHDNTSFLPKIYWKKQSQTSILLFGYDLVFSLLLGKGVAFDPQHVHSAHINLTGDEGVTINGSQYYLNEMNLKQLDSIPQNFNYIAYIHINKFMI